MSLDDEKVSLIERTDTKQTSRAESKPSLHGDLEALGVQ